MDPKSEALPTHPHEGVARFTIEERLKRAHAAREDLVGGAGSGAKGAKRFKRENDTVVDVLVMKEKDDEERALDNDFRNVDSALLVGGREVKRVCELRQHPDAERAKPCREPIAR
ncbi:MAG: hypothetical protein AAFQ77_03130 [Myxococcota bacterium]